MNAHTPTVTELARVVASALADERVRRHNADLPDPTHDEERSIARAAASRLIAQSRPAHGWGLEAIPDLDERRRGDEAIARVVGLGRLEPLLDNDDLTDVHVRGSRPVWVKMRSGERVELPPIVDTDADLVDLIRRIATRMGHREQRFDPAHPELNLQLPDGSRLFAAMEVSKRPTLVIRRHRFEFSSLEGLVDTGMMCREVSRFLGAAVRARRNIIIAGGTSSGKTTLLRALINEIPRTERIVTIEDSYELGLEHFEDAHPDHDSLQARTANVEGLGEVTMAELTKMALRMDPDRVIIGEVRGGEAFPMLLAMSQGNNGSMCTMHADSARSVFPKLLAYVSMASMGVPTETVSLLIASAVHFVVHLAGDGSRRWVNSVHEVVDCDGSFISSNEVFSVAGGTAQFAALRSATANQLEGYGFSRSRELKWA